MAHARAVTGIDWLHDGSGFFYSRYPAPAGISSTEGGKAGEETAMAKFQKIYYHALGTSQSEDQLVWQDEQNPDYMFGATVTEDGGYLLVSTTSSCDPVNRLFYSKLSGRAVADLPRDESGCIEVVRLVDNFDAEYDYVANDGSKLVFKTNLAAPRYRLISIDLDAAAAAGKQEAGAGAADAAVTEVVAESEHVLEWVRCCAHDRLLIGYLAHVKTVIELHPLSHDEGGGNERLSAVTLPSLGSVGSCSGRRHYNNVYFNFTSFLYPGTIFKYDASTPSTPAQVYKQTIVQGFDPSQYEAQQHFFKSKDGTTVPMFVVHSKGLRTDNGGDNPCLLYGYGGFNISLAPSFSPFKLVLLEAMLKQNVSGGGGVWAICNLRGGGEYGEDWHQGGTKACKQNVFDDFIGAAEELVAKGYTKVSERVRGASGQRLHEGERACERS
jgi:prolyl oligopeptidase